MLRIPELKQRHIVQSILYGALLTLWLTPEDNTTLYVSLLGAGLSFVLWRLAAFRWLGGRAFGRGQVFPALMIFGAAVGFGAVWCTVGLMVFKNAWHSHAFPDFPNSIIIGTAERLIPWTVAGGLLGGALGLILLGRR